MRSLLAPLRRVKARLERWRVDRRGTRGLGRRHRRSRDRIEIDITWACNLRCYNCNRSCEQAPTGESLSVADVARFVDDSLHTGKVWRRIRVLGGEPTLHPDLLPILSELLRYRARVPAVCIELATHGHGSKVRAVLASLPPGIEIDDSGKVSNTPAFATVNVAPVDLPSYRSADYKNGCPVTSDCGIGLTPRGYYPCAVAGGIDRIFELGLQREELPADGDDLTDQLDALCRLCGHFKREVEEPVRAPVQSETWRRAYARWAAARARRTSPESTREQPCR